MLYEKRTIGQEEALLCAQAEEAVVFGEIREITESQSGFRLLLKDCRIGEEKDFAIRNMYCYVDSAEGMKIGMRVRARGEAALPDPARNPGSFHYQHYCYARGVSGILYAESAEIAEADWLWVREWARTAGLFLERQLERIAEGEDVGILKAVLLGDKSDLGDEVYELYRKNGISHLLAISGLHVSVIGMGFWKLLRRSGFSYAFSGVTAFLLLYFYGLIAGFGTSVARAVFMMGLSFTAGIFGRTYDLPTAMCVPAAGLLLLHPYLLTQAAFQLSFLAVGAIFFPGEYLAKRWEVKGAAKNFLISAAIQIVTMPAVLYHSFEVPFYAVFLNLAVIPLMTCVLISGLAGTLLSLVWIPAGQAALGGAHAILLFYRLLCEMAEKIPGGIFAPGRPEGFAVFGFYTGVFFAVCLLGRRKKAGIAVFLTAFLFLLPAPQKGLTAAFLDVGQGDGIVLRSEAGAVLVDCGSSQKKKVGEDVLLPYLKSQGIRTLSAVFVSHGDSDHVSGIRSLLREETGIGIHALILPCDAGQDDALAELSALAKERGIEVFRAKAGEQFGEYLGSGISLCCLHPSAEDVEASFERNEDSMVLELCYGDFRLLLTGDLDQNGEEAILRREHLSPVTLLKAGHHGSASSTGEAFLESIRPSGVIFSYGRKNRYGHPSEEAVERCRSAGAEIYETGKQGAILVWTDGERMRVSGWLDR